MFNGKLDFRSVNPISIWLDTILHDDRSDSEIEESIHELEERARHLEESLKTSV